MPKVETADLAAREYWTPEQAARILGRGAQFWRRLYDAGTVRGYDVAGERRKQRYLLAASARAHLAGLTGLAETRKPAQSGRARYLARLHERLQQEHLQQATKGGSA